MVQASTAYQFPGNNPIYDGVVVIHQLLALSSQALFRDELTGLLQVPKNLSLQSEQHYIKLSTVFNSKI